LLSLSEARKYFPVETGITDQQLMQLVHDIDYFQEKILNDYLGLSEVENELYYKNNVANQ